jgi:zinc transporter
MTDERSSIVNPGSGVPHTTISGLIWGFHFDVDGTPRDAGLEGLSSDSLQGWLWLHFNLADARACQYLNSISHLSTSARQLLISAQDHQQLHTEEACVYGIFADLGWGLEGVTGEIGLLHFAMTEKLLVTGRRRALQSVETAHQAARAGKKFVSTGQLLESVVGHVVDAVDVYADILADKLDLIEEKVLADLVSDERHQLGRIRRKTVRLHRQLSILRSIVQRFEHDLGEHPIPALRLATGRLSQRLDWQDGEVVALRDRAHLLQEEIVVKAAEQTNRNLHLLAIVTTLFLPASLIAGIFGMNVGGLPLTERASGFLWVMVIVAAISVIVFWLLKRTGIIGR